MLENHKKKFKENFQNENVENVLLVSTIFHMLEVEEDKRSDFIELIEKLPSY